MGCWRTPVLDLYFYLIEIHMCLWTGFHSTVLFHSTVSTFTDIFWIEEAGCEVLSMTGSLSTNWEQDIQIADDFIHGLLDRIFVLQILLGMLWLSDFKSCWQSIPNMCTFFNALPSGTRKRCAVGLSQNFSWCMDLIDYEDKINAAMSMQQSRKCISIRPFSQTLTAGMGHILNFQTSKGIWV